MHPSTIAVLAWSEADLTDAIMAWGDRDPRGHEILVAQVYDDLCRLARRHLRGEHARPAMDPAELVHEAYLRLCRQTRCTWHSRAQFFAIASRVMRRVLVDRARQRSALRRGGACTVVIPLGPEALEACAPVRSTLHHALDEALVELATLDVTMARVVEYRFFRGLSESETAARLGVSRRTVTRAWTAAREWLGERLAEGGAERQSTVPGIGRHAARRGRHPVGYHPAP